MFNQIELDTNQNHLVEDLAETDLSKDDSHMELEFFSKTPLSQEKIERLQLYLLSTKSCGGGDYDEIKISLDNRLFRARFKSFESVQKLFENKVSIF